MPNKEPTKVSISPNAINMLLSITPIGGIHTPDINNPIPNSMRMKDIIS